MSAEPLAAHAVGPVVFHCIVCGRALDYAPLTVTRGATGTPEGVYCDDDAERLHEADDLNAETFYLSEDERHQVATALRALRWSSLEAIADRLEQSPHGVLTHWSPVTSGPALLTRDLHAGDRIRVPHPGTGAPFDVRVVSLTGSRLTVQGVGHPFTFDADEAEAWGTW